MNTKQKAMFANIINPNTEKNHVKKFGERKKSKEKSGIDCHNNVFIYRIMSAYW